MLFCGNPIEKVKRDGGEMVFGWLIAIYKNHWIEGIFHAVWRSPEGKLIDVTAPQSPRLDKDRTLFLEEKGYVFDASNPRPTQRKFPFCSRRLWPVVAERLKEADALRLEGKQAESEAKISSLQRMLNAEFRPL